MTLHAVLRAFRITAVGFATALSAPLHAQGGTEPAKPAPVVLRAARMIDVTTGQVIANPRIVVEGKQITAVNPASLPTGAKTIDLGDVTLLPGLMDAHTHLTGEIGPDMLLRPVTESEVDGAFRSARNGRTPLMGGFPNCRDTRGSATGATTPWHLKPRAC